MQSVESANKKIMEKMFLVRLTFEQIKHLCDMLDVCGIKYKHLIASSYINLRAVDFEELESEYYLSIIGTLTNYYTDSKQEEIHCREFYKIISSNNYLPKVEEHLGKCAAVLRLLIIEINKTMIKVKSVTRKTSAADVSGLGKVSGGVGGGLGIASSLHALAVSDKSVADERSPLYQAVEKIKRNIESAGHITVNIEYKKAAYDCCNLCSSKMNVNPALSELVCVNVACSAVKKLEGTAAEDMETDISGNKSKHADYSPNRHFKFWMERIQAKENKTFTSEELGKLERILKRDGPDHLTIYIMRDMLKETKLTAYNDHAALLMKLLTSIAPPVLNSVMLQKFSVKFNKVIAILETIKHPDGNRPYYPYFIYKIAEDEAIIAAAVGDMQLSRMLRKLMQYIHLQSDDTVRKNDMLFSEICKIADVQDKQSGDSDCKLTFRITE